MEKKIKFIVIGLVVLLSVSLFGIVRVENSRLEVQNKCVVLGKELEGMKLENEKLITQLDNKLKENDKLQEKIKVVQSELDKATVLKDDLQSRYEIVSSQREELLEKMKTYQEIEKKISSLETENVSLKERVTTLLSLEIELDQLKEENKIFKQKIEEARELLKKKDAPNVGLGAGVGTKSQSNTGQQAGMQSVDLPPIVVSSSSIAELTPGRLEGKILNVNDEYNFVVIDLGQSRGVQEGMVFEVLREASLLGTIKVIQTRLDIAACDIVQSEAFPEPGDKVRHDLNN